MGDVSAQVLPPRAHLPRVLCEPSRRWPRNGGTTQAYMRPSSASSLCINSEGPSAAPGAPAPPMAYAHLRFTRDADAAASSVTRAASRESPPSSPKAAAPSSPEAPTSPRAAAAEANEEEVRLGDLRALRRVARPGAGRRRRRRAVEPKRGSAARARVVGCLPTLNDPSIHSAACSVACDLATRGWV